MSFRIKSGNAYMGYFPDGYQFTSIESAAIFQRFYDSTVYGSSQGAFALYHEQTNKYVRELWYVLRPENYIQNDPGMSCTYQNNLLTIGRNYFYNVELEPLNNAPSQISGQFVNTRDSIEFTGRLAFDGVNDYKLTETVEFGQNGFAILLKFKPTGTPVYGESVFTRSNLSVSRVGVSNTFVVNSFLDPVQFSSDQNAACEVYIGVSYTSALLDIRANGNVIVNTNFQQPTLYDGTPFILGATRNGLNYGNYFSGEITTFKCYNSYADYSSTVGNYEYGLWAPFDSNLNTVHVISVDNYYTPNDIKSGYIIRGPGTFQISDCNWTIYCKFTAAFGDEEIFSIKSQDYAEFISGSIISLRRVSTTQLSFEYARTGGLEIIVTRLIDVANDIEYDFYMYDSYGSFGSNGYFTGNMFDKITKMYSPGGFLPGVYTVSCSKKDFAVYAGIVPVYEIISASYKYTGDSKTLSATSQTYGEFVDLYLDRNLKIGSKVEKFLGTSVPVFEYFGKTDMFYENLTSNAYYKNLRFVVREIFPKPLNQNYVTLYGQDGNVNTVYVYNDSTTLNGTTLNSITVDDNLNVYIGGYYGPHDMVISSAYFPKQLHQNIFVTKLNSWNSYGVSVGDTQVSQGYRPRITSMGSDGLNVYVCGLISESITVYDSARVGYTIPCTPPSTVGLIGDNRVFMIKYNPIGRIEWTVYSINLSSPNPYISVNKTGNVYMACSYDSDGWTYTPTIFRTPFGDVSTPINRGKLPFYKFTSYGQIIWIAGAGPGGTIMSSYTDEYDNGYTTGFSQEGLYAVNSDGTSTLPYKSRYDNTGYIIKYNPNGIALWYNLFTNGGWTEIHKCVADSTNIYMACNIQNNASLETSSGTITDMNYSTSRWACLVIKLDMDGNFVYRRVIDGIYDEADEIGYDIKLDKYSNVFVSGQYFSTNGVYIKNGADVNVFTIPPNSSTPASFLVKYSSSGTPLWERHIDREIVDYITENMPVGDQVYAVGISGSTPIWSYPNTVDSGTGFYNVYNSSDGFTISENKTQYGTQVPNFNQNDMSDNMVLSGYCRLLDTVRLNHSTLYIDDQKVLESPSSEIVSWTSNASPLSIFKYSLHVSNVTTWISEGPLVIEGISTILPEKIKPDDLIIQRIDYTPIQAQDFPAYDATITRYTYGANYTANSTGNVHVSNVFRNVFFNYGYGYAASYDYTYSNVHITLTANLYGESNLSLTSTDEVYIYVDNTLVISNTGSNVYTKNSEYPFRLEWRSRPEVSLSDSYIKLDGLEPVGNILAYTKTSNGIHYASSLLNGNGAAIAQTIEFSGTSPNTISTVSNTNLTCNLTRYSGNVYTLKIQNTNNLPINETYAYEPSFKSVLVDGYSLVAARGNFQSNVFDSSRIVMNGYFSVPESGTYTVSNVVTPVQGPTFLDTTVFTHNIKSKYYEAGKVVPYSFEYYCPRGANTQVDVIFSNVHTYRLSQQITTTDFITRIPNFYRSNTAVANYKTITA